MGQALYNSGLAMGNRIKSLIPPLVKMVIFIATPGTGNIQPRYDGAVSVLSRQGLHREGGRDRSADLSGVSGREGVPGRAQVDTQGRVRGGRGLDRAARPGAGERRPGKIPAGGFDLTPGTLTAINTGQLDFTIDQNPYLQGFLPVLYLYLFNLTGGLVSPPDTDTGLTFVTKSNVGPYLNTKPVRGLGQPAAEVLVPRSGAIQNPLATTSTLTWYRGL